MSISMRTVVAAILTMGLAGGVLANEAGGNTPAGGPAHPELRDSTAVLLADSHAVWCLL